MYLGIDTATKLTEKTAKAVKDAGFAFVGRYLVPPQKYTRKALTEKEAKIITDAGLSLLTVWETTASRAKEGASAGAVDGVSALKCAHDINMPANGIIYFAVDFEAMDADMDAIAAYLAAARRQTEEYDIGVYGSYKVIENIRWTGICKAYWQCVGWSYGKKSSVRNVYQVQFEKVVSSLNVDINECEDMSASGIWTYNEGKGESPVFEKRYDTVDSLPAWATPTVLKLILAGHLRGSGDVYDADGYPADLNLSYDMLRILVILDRARTFDNK